MGNSKTPPDQQAISRGYAVLVLIAFLILIIVVQNVLNGLTMTSAGYFLLWPVTYSILPILFLFVVFRTVFGPAISAVTLLLVFTTLSAANYIKRSQNGLPLTWNDISTSDNFSVVNQYIEVSTILVSVVSAVLMLILARFIDRRFHGKPNRRISSILLLAFLLPFLIAFTNHPNVFGRTVGELVSETLASAGVAYVNWNPNLNMNRNGLAVYLLQTSRSTLPELATSEEAAQYRKLEDKTLFRFVDSPPNSVILILCESCYYDERNFSDSFQGLRERGFKEFRAISPVYKANTPQASFELLTGLPANSPHLNGVFYQEYAKFVRNETDALPFELTKINFSTSVWHNWTRQFWNRDIINPKMGFESFASLENMVAGELDWGWARDKIMYDYVLENSSLGDQPNFMFLTTVYSHGGYERRNDLGESAYIERLEPAIEDLNMFVDEVLSRDPRSLIIVIGDHKPSLEEFFYKTGVLEDPLTTEELGDVPMLVHYHDEEAVGQFEAQAMSQPFYCVSVALNNVFLGASVPSHNFANENQLCNNGALKPIDMRPSDYPSWLYRQMLFPQN